MPKPHQEQEIIDRGKSNPKLGARKFKRYPSNKPGYIGPKRIFGARKIKTIGATISPNEVEDPLSIYVSLRNGTGHPVTFWVGGVLPEVFVEIEGNTTYAPPMTRFGTETPVEIRLDGPEGELLATDAEEEDD